MKRVLIGTMCVALVLGLAISFGCGKQAPTPPAATVNDTTKTTTPPAPAPAPAPSPVPDAATPAPAPDATAPAAAAPAASGDVKKFTIKIDESSIIWNAHVPIGWREGGWSGFEGKIEMTGADLATTKADVTIDMKTAFSDHPEITKKLLGEDHFFKPATWPTSTFKTTAIKASATAGMFDVTGDLTIRDKTKNITFPATMTIEGANLKVKAEFELNRKDFDILYQSSIGDYAIDDMCKVKLDVLCVPAA